MTLARTVLVVYALLLAGGGYMGYAKAGSTVSLIAGLASGAVCLIALLITRSSPLTGCWAGVGCAAVLTILFTVRLVKSGKFMPSGMMLIVSALALGLLVLSALREAGSRDAS